MIAALVATAVVAYLAAGVAVVRAARALFPSEIGTLVDQDDAAVGFWTLAWPAVLMVAAVLCLREALAALGRAARLR